MPEEFERQIMTGLDEANVVRGFAKVITTSAGRKIPVAATHSTAQWTAENGAYTESGPTFDQKTIDAFKLTDLVKVSIELLRDSMFDLESYIAGEFARAFGIAEEEAFCVGTGTGQPTGIDRLDNLYDKIGDIDDQLQDVNEKIRMAYENQITSKQVYQILTCFDKIYFEMTDLEKKEFYRNFIDEIKLYSERQSDGRIVKQINFNFPVYYNGNEGSAIRLPDENTAETVCLLQRSGR